MKQHKAHERFIAWAKQKNEEYSISRQKRRIELGFPDRIGRSITPRVTQNDQENQS